SNEVVPIHGISKRRKYYSILLFYLMYIDGAEVMAEYGSDVYAKMSALTKNKFGYGEAWYVGTVLEQEMLNELLAYILHNHVIKGFGSFLEGVVITVRVEEVI